MPLHLLPALPTDIPTLITLQFDAFHSDPFMRIMFPVHPPTPSTHAHAVARLHASLHDPTTHVLKVVDPDLAPGKQIVSFGKWQIWGSPRPQSEWMQEEKREWGEGVNVEAADGFLGRLQEARRRILGGTPCASEFFPAGALSVTVDTLAAVGQIVRDARRGVRGLSC